MRQAENDVSIPDQRRQGETWCASHGYELVETFVDAGVSATSDRRPEFQRLIETASEQPAPFDIILVHSFSRFFRDHFELELHIRKLARNGVKLVSITQTVGDDPMHVMMRRVMTLFDEYQSRENGKHTLRAMKENARQGFWNGSLPPIGYRIVEAEKRGAKVKKTLAIDPIHADTVRLIYRLTLSGDGVTGPMGVKAIVKYLDDRKIYTRDGGRWGIGQLHKILTRTTYVGRHRFNTRSKDKTCKPNDEVITVAVPPLIEQATFDAVQAHLRARNPKALAPRIVNNPNMLTGLLHCAHCGSLMTMRTGKGGRYRYYACQAKARAGTSGCSGMAIPMDALDMLIAKHMTARLLGRDRLKVILAGAVERRREQIARDGVGRLDACGRSAVASEASSQGDRDGRPRPRRTGIAATIGIPSSPSDPNSRRNPAPPCRTRLHRHYNHCAAVTAEAQNYSRGAPSGARAWLSPQLSVCLRGAGYSRCRKSADLCERGNKAAHVRS
jgi:DNA invertase Pin-like site-specific DNA recombinase